MLVQARGDSASKHQLRLLVPLNCLLSAHQVFDRPEIMTPRAQVNCPGRGERAGWGIIKIPEYCPVAEQFSGRWRLRGRECYARISRSCLMTLGGGDGGGDCGDGGDVEWRGGGLMKAVMWLRRRPVVMGVAWHGYGLVMVMMWLYRGKEIV